MKTKLLILLIISTISACTNGQKQNKTTMTYKHTNDLIHESSPYLLQHAHNPVNWHSWNKETLEMAKRENKPLLISIGYSSCHWCHVMEHQSFEKEDVAKIMNDNFICIKVDREEHPDIDQIYMNAVQLITGRGGWPLNCFALPDGRPFYGGTYFNRDQWVNLLNQISNLYKHKYAQVLSYAASLEKGIKESEQVVKLESNDDFKISQLRNIINNWENQLDFKEGGSNGAPKFPMPNSYKFLMRYTNNEKDKHIDSQVELTLNKMANGGIYDQLGGGFARYSTDSQWKVPHFEKMLYDNAQLVSLYSDAYKKYNNIDYKRVVEETLEFINREMTNKDGLFYSALDADSDGEEGKFYVWTIDEIDSILKEESPIFKDFYQMNEQGYWENDNYILMRSTDIGEVAKKHLLSTEELLSKIDNDKTILMNARDKRIRPGLDDKSLLSWNALMIEGYCDAFSSIGNREYLKRATKAMDFILNNMEKKDGSFWHTYKNGESKINALLDDYATLIQSLIKLSEVGAGNKYLYKADEISKLVIEKFYDEKTGMFFYTSSDNKVLVSRKIEIYDRVTPASNSIMANNLYKLSLLMDNDKYGAISHQMLNNVKDNFSAYGSSLSNWGLLMMDYVTSTKEVAICGKDATTILNKLQKHYLPNTIWASDININNKIGLLQNRYIKDKTLIYVCVGKQCELPTSNISDALHLLGN